MCNLIYLTPVCFEAGLIVLRETLCCALETLQPELGASHPRMGCPQITQTSCSEFPRSGVQALVIGAHRSRQVIFSSYLDYWEVLL